MILVELHLRQDEPVDIEAAKARPRPEWPLGLGVQELGWISGLGRTGLLGGPWYS